MHSKTTLGTKARLEQCSIRNSNAIIVMNDAVLEGRAYGVECRLLHKAVEGSREPADPQSRR